MTVQKGKVLVLTTGSLGNIDLTKSINVIKHISKISGVKEDRRMIGTFVSSKYIVQF